MPVPVLPDPLALGVAVLKANSAISTAVGGRVHTRVPEVPTWPLLVVSVISADPSQDAAWQRVQLDVWADIDTDRDGRIAQQIARTIVANIRDLRGTYTAGKVWNSAVMSGPLPLPDPDTGRPRWWLDVQLDTAP